MNQLIESVDHLNTVCKQYNNITIFKLFIILKVKFSIFADQNVKQNEQQKSVMYVISLLML